jgi:hypothetical protein
MSEWKAVAADALPTPQQIAALEDDDWRFVQLVQDDAPTPGQRWVLYLRREAPALPQ